jgi:GT2 family glycosyltransferase
MPYRGPYGPKEFGASRVDWVEGSWLLTPASAWERVGGLDDQFIMYVEDVDYCRSLREIGLATVHMPAMVYTHFVGFSMKRLPNVYAGLRFFHAKFSGRISRWLADVVMKRGLQFKVAVYGALALLLRNPKYGERSRSMQRVLDVWDQMAVPGARFQ